MSCCGFTIPGMAGCSCGGSCGCSSPTTSGYGSSYSGGAGAIPGLSKGGGPSYSPTGGGTSGYHGPAGGGPSPIWTGPVGGSSYGCWRGPVGGGGGVIPGTPIVSAACGDPFAPVGGGGPVVRNGSPDLSNPLDPFTRFIPIGPFYGGGGGGGAGGGGGGVAGGGAGVLFRRMAFPCHTYGGGAPAGGAPGSGGGQGGSTPPGSGSGGGGTTPGSSGGGGTTPGSSGGGGTTPGSPGGGTTPPGGGRGGGTTPGSSGGGGTTPGHTEGEPDPTYGNPPGTTPARWRFALQGKAGLSTSGSSSLGGGNSLGFMGAMGGSRTYSGGFGAVNSQAGVSSQSNRGSIPGMVVPGNTCRLVKCGPDVTDWLLQRLRENAAEAAQHRRQFRWFAQQVGSGKRWDYKLLPMVVGDCPTKCGFSVEICGECVRKDLVGNIHYAVVGHAAGMTLNELLGGSEYAAAEQQIRSVHQTADVLPFELTWNQRLSLAILTFLRPAAAAATAAPTLVFGVEGLFDEPEDYSSVSETYNAAVDRRLLGPDPEKARAVLCALLARILSKNSKLAINCPKCGLPFKG
jgi:hypothetical protein